MTDPDVEIILPDDDQILICPKCYTHNPEGSNFCLNCGFSLRKGLSSRAKWIWLLVFVLIFTGGMVYFYFGVSRLGLQKPASEMLPSTVPTPLAKTDIVVAEDDVVEKDEVIPPEPEKLKIPIGVVVIKDITGKIINEVPVAVVGGGWVALPKQVCLGGSDWILKMGPDTEVSIAGGIFNDYDTIGLWRILEDFTIDGPELYPWTAEEPLVWLSLTSQNSPEAVELGSTDEQGNFVEGLLVDDFNELGIMVQHNRVVGWTFGDYISGAFIWKGDEGKYLIPEIQVDDFYRFTFADSREEEFTRALAMGDEYNGLERLEAFANGFRFESKLSVKETPSHLQKEVVIESMRPLITQTLQAGFAREVANIFDSQILIEAADIELLMEVAQANSQSYGFEDAIDLTENVIAGLSPAEEPDAGRLQKFLSDFYQNWVGVFFKKGDLQAAWRAYRIGSRNLPEDINIHLLGVQLALAENNWAEAESLLAMKEYPLSLKDKIENLQTQISEQKAKRE